MTATPFWIAGQPQHGDRELIVNHPFDDGEAGRTSWADTSQVEAAVAAAASVADEFAETPAHVRSRALRHVADRLSERAEQVAQLITAESGKPIRWSRVEVTRAVSTFTWAAEEARRFGGTMQRLDTDPNAEGRTAVTRRFPYGPVLGITPFNFPVNLVAHKLAPSIAVGAPILIKPAPATPLSALLLGELLAETDLPAGAVSVVPVPNEEAPALAADERFPVISFTGSDVVGWQLADSLPRRKVTLELGGNAAALVCADFDDLDWAADRIATFGNYQAGQSCISVQRVFVHRDHYDRFLPLLVDKVAALATGDPTDDDCVVGPLISSAAAQRVTEWIDEAVNSGARLHCGGQRDGNLVSPAVLTDVPRDAKLAESEVFGPVLIVEPVADDTAGLAAINASRYGLQAGVFTTRIDLAATAHRRLKVGGVIIGDVPSFRADQMPYGGTKASGTGREGVASAMEDLTEAKVLVLPLL
ncbi:succinate semialdehyde dehydrogenase [Stackebrandtia endophytica]|uniref:Succinate semialdehyde dehydrogenase n=1 Tax=Stackebrandtia endophytica TaxID=1496996 RepID=A0A543AX17_9ACTN|nr:aldehyde dehydrogenase family protein [Stackebrandtia endophytica]TQL77117.1 succinate semialdehyde dehydrogenase [Stackebrandtia endophytica]